MLDVTRLDLRVGRIVTAQIHPEADGAYLEDVETAEESNRVVISGMPQLPSIGPAVRDKKKDQAFISFTFHVSRLTSVSGLGARRAGLAGKVPLEEMQDRMY